MRCHVGLGVAAFRSCSVDTSLWFILISRGQAQMDEFGEWSDNALSEWAPRCSMMDQIFKMQITELMEFVGGAKNMTVGAV